MALFEDDDDDDGEVFELDAYEEDMSAMPSPVRLPCFFPTWPRSRSHPPTFLIREALSATHLLTPGSDPTAHCLAMLQEEDRHRQIVNVLGYRVKSRASLSARRGSLRTGAVTVKRRDVRRAHVAFAKKALEVRRVGCEVNWVQTGLCREGRGGQEREGASPPLFPPPPSAWPTYLPSKPPLAVTTGRCLMPTGAAVVVGASGSDHQAAGRSGRRAARHRCRRAADGETGTVWGAPQQGPGQGGVEHYSLNINSLYLSGLILQAAESDDPEVRGLVVDAYCAASSLILRSASPAPSSAEGVAGSDMVLEVFEQVRAGNHYARVGHRDGVGHV